MTPGPDAARRFSTTGPVLRRLALALPLLLITAPAAALELQLPVACAMGEDCFIQNYVDRDPGPGFTDYQCGHAGHDEGTGVDFALRGLDAMASGVPVLAAAAGVVKAVRDGEPGDGRYRKGRECGNGVVIDHGSGWETQYCHLRTESVSVRPGGRLAAGAPIGFVGRSGNADTPHLSFAIRRDGTVIDPFHGPDAPPSGCPAPAAPLWAASVAAALDYAPGRINRLGLWPGRPDWNAIDAGAARLILADRPLVAYAEVRNLPEGWRVMIRLLDPDGAALAGNVYTADRHKARYRLFAGRKPPEGGWAARGFTPRVTVHDANGDLVAER